jgi:hypothetical protein
MALLPHNQFFFHPFWGQGVMCQRHGPRLGLRDLTTIGWCSANRGRSSGRAAPAWRPLSGRCGVVDPGLGVIGGGVDRGTNETPGSESKGGRQKLHLGPPYKTNMSSPGPGLRLERPKAR